MKTTSTRYSFEKIYASIFVFFLLTLLLSFLPIPIFPLSHLSDHFRWRKNLIELYANLRFQLGDRVYNGAVIGKEGWIFYTGQNSMIDYQIAHAPRRKLLSDLQERLDQLSLDLEGEGITLFVVVVPNKSTVYPQYMPDEIPVLGQKREIDEFVRVLKGSGKTHVIDLRKALEQASQIQPVYYKTDTHWNDMGAYCSYVEIMNSLSSLNPTLQPRALSEFTYVQTKSSTRDLVRVIGLTNYTEANWMLVPKYVVHLRETKEKLPNEDLYIRTVTNSDSSLPHLLILHDSFYGTLARFIEPHFSRTKTIPYSEKNATWTLDWIEQEHPDIVIIEFVERYLDDSLPALLLKNATVP
jgi:alginate O-acetyltransferase complex protein AlgJ